MSAHGEEAASNEPQQPTDAATRSVARKPVAEPRPLAVLDRAHLGDIEGAFGRIPVERDRRAPHAGRSGCSRWPPSSVRASSSWSATTTPAGSPPTRKLARTTATRLLWTLLLLIPVLIVNQEMVVRLGAVTGVGHARLINERFGRGWGWFSVGDLFLLNFLTIVTEFIGMCLAGAYVGISQYIVVPIAAVALVAIMATGSFRRWERAMFVFIAISLVQVPMLLPVPPALGPSPPNRSWCPVSQAGPVLRRGAADHRHRRHHRRPVAAVLPAVQHRRQAHHAPVHQLRTGRHRAGLFRGRHRCGCAA